MLDADDVGRAHGNGEIAQLRARARVAQCLAAIARDREVAGLLIQISDEFEEEAWKLENEAAR